MQSTRPDPTRAAGAPRATGLVLASASPRRRQMLAEAGLRFEVVAAEIDESPAPGEAPATLVERLARTKALAVARGLPARPRRPVLGSDTIVVGPDDDVLGKPRDAAHAVEQLSRLVGGWHRVMTAIAVAWSGTTDVRSRVVVTRVQMRPARADELVDYVAIGESFDKAGGYAIQGEGQRFVIGLEGSRSNVIGLPLDETLALLAEAGVGGGVGVGVGVGVGDRAEAGAGAEAGATGSDPR